MRYRITDSICADELGAMINLDIIFLAVEAFYPLSIMVFLAQLAGALFPGFGSFTFFDNPSDLRKVIETLEK